MLTPLIAACSSDGDSSDDASGDGSSGDGSSGEATSTTDSPEPTTTGSSEQGDGGQAGTDLRWARANLGFVSAYVLARGSSAAVIDTGTSGSATAIGQTLGSLGLNYGDVDHVILTHKHGDHIGSMAEVVAEASSATVYAGEADLGGIDDAAVGGDGIVPLTGGEDVFGLEVVATPGHTAGHVAVIDHTTGLLVAGDAIFTEGGGATEGPERFFEDVPQSRDSIRLLAELSFNTLLVGHGDPLEGNADTAVADLAASLP